MSRLDLWYDEDGRDIVCCVCGTCYTREDVEEGKKVSYDDDGERRYICIGTCDRIMWC